MSRRLLHETLVGCRVCAAYWHNQKSFDCRDSKKTCCSEALSEYIGVDPNLVVLWITDADDVRRSLLECGFLFNFI